MAEKEKLLLLLEKDIPFRYYCHYCLKLHRWHGRWSRSITPWYKESLPCKGSIANHLFLSPTFHIPYYYARLVMNRHFYGSKHGLPLDVLNKRAQFFSRLDGVVNSVSQHVHIFNDQLLVLSSMHLQGKSALLRNCIDSYGDAVCKHLPLSQGFPGFSPMQLPELAKKGNAPGQFLACGPAFRSCTFCPTDYTINIAWKGEKKECNIKVLVYRGLGDCRTPSDWHWRTMSTLYPDEELSSAYSLYHQPGSVRDQWTTAGGITKGMTS